MATSAPVLRETKPFYRTSEFYGVVGVAVVDAVDAFGSGTNLKLSILAAVYAVARGLAKAGVPYVSATAQEVATVEQELSPVTGFTPPADPAATDATGDTVSGDLSPADATQTAPVPDVAPAADAAPTPADANQGTV